jgi:DNA topoisomerase I
MIDTLVYVSDREPGIARVRNGRRFRYTDPDGHKIVCDQELARIAALGLPPAYENVWICPLHNGHIQATGLDAAKRKQYRYHADWTTNQDQAKYELLAAFGRALPKIRRKVDDRLNSRTGASQFDKELACAALIRLIDHTAIRIGGRSKTSQGATTLNTRNVIIERNRIHFRFVAKGGKRVRTSLDDRRLHRILSKIHDLPGKRLFQYVGASGDIHPLDSGDVNNWLKETTGIPELSAKMFRTWHGSVAALSAARPVAQPTIKLVSQAAADRLLNTPAIARKSYIHPAIFEFVTDAGVLAQFDAVPIKRKAGLTAAECRLLQLIDQSG